MCKMTEKRSGHIEMKFQGKFTLGKFRKPFRYSSSLELLPQWGKNFYRQFDLW